MKKKKLVVANWKMNPQTHSEAKQIFLSTKRVVQELRNTEVCICPPFLFLQDLLKLNNKKNLFLGSQNISSEEKGAYTGEVSANMIKNLDAKFTIIGHSERRAMGETGEIIRKKLTKAFLNKLIPILCIGEKEKDGEGNYLTFLKNQIKESLVDLEKKDLHGLIIAYEPVWAIGKSHRESMSATDIHEMTLVIKKIGGELFGKDISNSFKILYGGSVEMENAKGIIENGNIDGFLVGHASLEPKHFSQILKIADSKKIK